MGLSFQHRITHRPNCAYMGYMANQQKNLDIKVALTKLSYFDILITVSHYNSINGRWNVPYLSQMVH